MAERKALLLIWICAIPFMANASVPPEFIELTPQNIQALGFKFKIWKRGSFSFIDLKFPPHVDGRLTPHSAQVTASDLHGNLLLDSMSWAREKHLLIENRYNHQQTDISASVAFCAANASSCKDFGISSVSKFIRDNTKPGDILSD